jgi:hypothetical protein
MSKPWKKRIQLLNPKRDEKQPKLNSRSSLLRKKLRRFSAGSLLKQFSLKLFGSKQLCISWFGGVQIISQGD